MKITIVHFLTRPYLEWIFSILKFVYTEQRKQNLTPSGTSIVRDYLIFQQTNKHPLPHGDNGRKHPDVMAFFSIVIFLVIACQ